MSQENVEVVRAGSDPLTWSIRTPILGAGPTFVEQLAIMNVDTPDVLKLDVILRGLQSALEQWESASSKETS